MALITVFDWWSRLALEWRLAAVMLQIFIVLGYTFYKHKHKPHENKQQKPKRKKAA